MLSEDQVGNRLIKKCSWREQNNISVKWVDDSNRTWSTPSSKTLVSRKRVATSHKLKKLRKSLFWQWTQMKSYKADFERDVWFNRPDILKSLNLHIYKWLVYVNSTTRRNLMFSAISWKNMCICWHLKLAEMSWEKKITCGPVEQHTLLLLQRRAPHKLAA